MFMIQLNDSVLSQNSDTELALNAPNAAFNGKF